MNRVSWPSASFLVLLVIRNLVVSFAKFVAVLSCCLAFLHVLVLNAVPERLLGLIKENLIIVVACLVLRLVEGLVTWSTFVESLEVLQNLWLMHEHIVSILLSNGLTVHEYVILLMKKTLESVDFHGMLSNVVREKLLHLPVCCEGIQGGEVWRVEVIERRKLVLFFLRREF